MKRRFEQSIPLRLLLLFVALLLLGLAPRPHAFDQALHQATRAIADGSPLRSYQSILQGARLAPWRADLWELAGVYALQAGETDSAIEYLERASASASLSSQGWLALGSAYRQSGDLPAAIHAWEQAVDRHGPSAQALEFLSQAQLDQGDFPAAIDNLKALVGLKPQDARLMYRLGMLIATQDPPAAQSYLDQAGQLDQRYQPVAAGLRRAVLSARFAEDPTYTLLVTGRTLAALGEWSLASRAFQQATQSRPDYAEAWAYLGEARQHAGQGTLVLPDPGSGDGLAEIQKALALDPDSLAALTLLSMYYARQGSFDLALGALRKAITLDPGNLSLQVQLAHLLAASGELYQAKEAYLQVIQRAPQVPAYTRLLVQFSLDYDFEVAQTALPLARRLAGQYPNDPANLDSMAQVLIHRGDLVSAARFLERALVLDPRNAPGWLHLAQVWVLQGDRKGALEALDQVIALSPGSPESAQAQRLIEEYFH
jgi:tetratricopeptide (TPR) repeat protein